MLLWKPWVKFLPRIKCESRHYVSKASDIALLRQSVRKNNGTWIRLRRFANVLMNRNLLSWENQEAVDPKLSVLQKTLKMLAKWSVHRTISQEQLKVPERSLNRWIVIRDLHVSAFRRVPVQVISEATKQKRHRRCQKLIHRLPAAKTKTVFFTGEKTFIWIRRWTTRMIVFGLRVRRETLINVGWLLREQVRQARHSFCGRMFRWEGKIAFNSRQDQSEC